MSALAAKRTVPVVASALMLIAICIAGPAGGAPRDRVRPSQPASPRVTAATPTSVALAWRPSKDNVGVIGYRIVHDDRSARSVGASYVVRGLTCGTGVNVSIAALDAAGNASQPTRVIGATAACVDSMPPSAPTGFTQAATSVDAVVLRWDPSADATGVVAYGVYRDISYSSTFEPSVTLTGLSCGAVEAVSIDAVDAAGNRSSRRSVYVETSPCPTMQPFSATSGASASAQASPDWTRCAAEGETCAFSGTTEVRYGANGKWTSPRTFTNGVACTNRVFGDPLYGVRKSCERRSTGSAPPATTPPPSTWAYCASEGTACSFSGTREVRYGASGKWTGARTFTNGVACTNKVFGDPIYGVVKACESRGVVSSAAPPPAPPADTSPPAKPILSLGPVGQDGVLLSWRQGVDNVGIHHYNVWLDSMLISQTTELSYRYAGLRCATDYVLGLEAVDAAGNKSVLAEARWPIRTLACPSGSSTPPADVVAPSMPTRLGVSAATNTTVRLGWTAATDNVGVAGYRVKRNDVLEATVPSSGTTIDELACGTAYTFGVSAFDGAGNESPTASVIGSTTACEDVQAPSAPASLVATSRTATSVALSWSPSSDNTGVAGYGLYRDGTRVATSATSSAIFAGLTCATNYTLAVDAYDGSGNRSPQTVIMVATTACPDTQAPTAPSNVAVSARTTTSIGLSWTASSDNVGVTAYRVYRDGTQVAQVSSTAATVSGLACGIGYSLSVRAIDGAGNVSSPSAITASTTACADQTPPSTPGGLGVSSITTTGAGLSWQASSDNTGVVSYAVSVGSSQVGQTAALTYALSGLTCGSGYTARVVAVDAAGNRSAAASTTFTTASCAAPPTAPTTISPSEFSQRATAGATVSDVTVTGSVSVRNPDVTLRRVTVRGTVEFTSTAHRSRMLESSAGGLYIFGADDILVEGSSFDGHAYGTVSQNLIWEQPVGAVPQRTTIRGNTFRRFYGDDPSVHSEALFVGYSDTGVIDGNTFIDNGNTAHVFFSYWSASASTSLRPRNWCVKNNTFKETRGAYFSINFRDEITSGDNVRVQPGQPSVMGLSSHPQFNGSC